MTEHPPGSTWSRGTPACCNGHGCSDPDETCEDAPRRPGSNHADCWICPHRCREHGEQEDRP